MADDPEALVVLALTTEADAQSAETLARALLERRLVGCVSLMPLRSLYHWQGALECAEEVQLLLKTSPQALPALQAAVAELHSYNTPEWLTWSVSSSDAYGGWLRSVLSPGDGPAAGEDRPGAGAPVG